MSQAYTDALVARMFTPEPPTWVGQGVLPHQLYVGTEKGRLFLVDPDRGVRRDPSPIFGSGEAINGAAFTDKLMAVSNRSEVVIQEMIPGIKPRVLEGGAHGVIASKGGRILAPMGIDGLLIVSPSDDTPPIPTVLKSPETDLYFYQTVQIGPLEQGQEWFATACRDDGVARIMLGPGREYDEFEVRSKKNPRTQKNADIVSLCSLNRPGYPYAMAVLSMDRTVYFTADIRTAAFTGMALDELDGTPYSVHSAQGHLFILTSDKLYVMNDFAERAVYNPGSFSREPITSFSLEVDAVDCSIAHDEYLLLVHDHYVTVNRISMLSQGMLLATNTRSPDLNGSDEVSTVDPEFPILTSESQEFHPLTMTPHIFEAA
jgi:hypothetical protein